MRKGDNDLKKAVEILGLVPPFSLFDVKQAYKQCAMRQHPDRTAVTATVEEAMKEINWAYKILRDCMENVRIPMSLLVDTSLTEEDRIRRRFYYDWVPASSGEGEGA